MAIDQVISGISVSSSTDDNKIPVYDATSNSFLMEVPSGGWATTALDNLASVAINTTLVSDTDNTDDLGTTLKKWANLFVTTIGATATRVTKGWFTDLEVTNAIAGSITGNAATVTTNANLSGDVTSSGNTTTIANDAVTLAKMAGGTAWNLITYDASGNPAAVSTGTAWQVLTSNGAGAAPTMQTVGWWPSVLTSVPYPNYPHSGASVNRTAGNVNTQGNLGLFVIPFWITVNKVIVRCNTVSVAGSIKLLLYSEDGQTQIFSVTTASIAAGGQVITSLGAPVAVSAWNYYFFWMADGTADLTLSSYGSVATVWGAISNVTWEPVTTGIITGLTASTPPATFTPSSITATDSYGAYFRLDN